MIQLSTAVQIPTATLPIDYRTRIMMLGSCFVENIGNYLKDYRFQVVINPNGIVYNPFSVANVLEDILTRKAPLETELIRCEEQWQSLQHHSIYSCNSKEMLYHRIEEEQNQLFEYIRNCNLFIITWGTAWVYRYLLSNRIVANCHKLPAHQFERFKLTVSDIVIRYSSLISLIRNLNPKARFLFTVSPIRHLKDGLHENQLSKATLLLAIDQLEKQFQEITYFPSYEIVMDELRDYRFYKEDMTHITPTGIAYIWERFCSSQLDARCLPYLKRIDKINQFRAHRPFNPDSEAYKQALLNIEQQSQAINQELERF